MTAVALLLQKHCHYTIGDGLDQTQDSVGSPSRKTLVDNSSTECEPSDDTFYIMQL